MKNQWSYKQSDKKADMKSTSGLNFQLLFLFYKNSTKFLIVLFACMIFWCSYGYTAGGSNELYITDSPGLVDIPELEIAIDIHQVIVNILLNSESLNPETTAKISELEKPDPDETLKILIDSGVLSYETVVKIRTNLSAIKVLPTIKDQVVAQISDFVSSKKRRRISIEKAVFICRNHVLNLLREYGILNDEAFNKALKIINDEVNQKPPSLCERIFNKMKRPKPSSVGKDIT